MDGAALEVGENRRQVVQGLVEPLLAAVNVFALGDVVGQVLQDHSGLFSVFLCDRAGKGVDLVNGALSTFVPSALFRFVAIVYLSRPILRLAAWESTPCQPRSEGRSTKVSESCLAGS